MKKLKILFSSCRNESFNFKLVLVLITVVMVVGSMTVSATTDNWSWFQRSGSILVLCPIIFQHQDFLSGRNLNIVITVLGTLIWGWGDLIGEYIYF